MVILKNDNNLLYFFLINLNYLVFVKKNEIQNIGNYLKFEKVNCNSFILIFKK